MLVNLKPFTMDGKPYHYKLGIKSKADSFDQETKGLISLRWFSVGRFDYKGA